MFSKNLVRKKLAAAVVISVFFIFSRPVLAQESYVYVITEKLNDKADIRKGPGTEYEIISSVNLATMLEVVGEDTNKDWLQVKSGDGNGGWIRKNLITYQKTVPSGELKKKGTVDVKVAREQVLKWWANQSTSSNPICDICNTKVPRDTGYLLSAKQVLNSEVYHEMIKSSFPSQYSQMVENFERDKTPWLICDICIEKYFVNVAGTSNLQELEKGMIADENLKGRIIKAVKKYYSVEFVKDKLDKNELWIAEDKENNTNYPITPLIGREILKQIEEEMKKEN